MQSPLTLWIHLFSQSRSPLTHGERDHKHHHISLSRLERERINETQKGDLGKKCLLELEYRCVILWLNRMRLSTTQTPLLYSPPIFLTLDSLRWVNTEGAETWRGWGWKNAIFFAKPGPPPELWTLYFIQHCQLAAADRDHHYSSSLALYSTDATSLQVAPLKTVWIWQKLLICQRAEVSAAMSQLLMDMSLKLF